MTFWCVTMATPIWNIHALHIFSSDVTPRNTVEPEWSANSLFFLCFFALAPFGQQMGPSIKCLPMFHGIFLKMERFFFVCVVCYSIMYLKGFVLCCFFLYSIRPLLLENVGNCWESFWLCCSLLLLMRQDFSFIRFVMKLFSRILMKQPYAGWRENATAGIALGNTWRTLVNGQLGTFRVCPGFPRARL